MSTTSTERRESMGIVGDALRRPIQEAVKEGVKEAIREDDDIRVRRAGQGSQGYRGQEGSNDEGGSGRGKFTMLLLLGVGVAALVLWRRQNGGSGGPGGMTQSIREQSKTGHGGESGPGSTPHESGMREAAETARESTETEDATPGAGSE